MYTFISYSKLFQVTLNEGMCVCVFVTGYDLIKFFEGGRMDGGNNT